MNTAIWIVLCLLASVGLAQSVAWLKELSRRPKRFRKGYHVIPLYQDVDGIEAQLRYSLNQVGWGGGNGEIVLLVDMGLSGECLALCESMLRQSPGLFYCRSEELSDSLTSLDKIQMKTQ